MGGGEGASAFCRILYDSPYPHIGAISSGFKAVGIYQARCLSHNGKLADVNRQHNQVDEKQSV